MKATNLQKLSRELRASLISEFNFKNFSIKLKSSNGTSSMNIEIGDNFKKRKVLSYVKDKDFNIMLENGTTKKFKYIFILKK